MRSKTSKIVAALAVAGVVAAGGSAFTASNTIPDSVAGYGTSNITGATATSLDYTLSADGTTIAAADLVFSGDQTGRTVKAGFGSDALTACTAGTYDSVADETPVTCSGYSQSTASSSTFNVAVS
jgi:hypothetical protein